MILYAYRFLYNFYGLILVSGFVDVKISTHVKICKMPCRFGLLREDFNIRSCQIFIFYRFFSEVEPQSDEKLKV